MIINLQTPIEELPKVGEKISKKLNKLGIYNIKDLLFYYPSRYEDFSKVSEIADLKQGEHATIKGQVSLIANKRAFRRRMYITECLISDDSASIKAVWFNQPFITKIIKSGEEYYFSGKVELNKYGMQLSGPNYERVNKNQTHTARIIPIYHLTENLTAKQIRFLIKSVLSLSAKIHDWVPADIIKNYKLLKLPQAIREIHFPTNMKTLGQAVKRLKFDEHFTVQLKTESLRRQISALNSPPIKFDEKKTKEFVAQLPFTLTASQKKSAWEILQDLAKRKPMNRILQGDVGSGKTVVAALAVLNAKANGWQSAIMTPTEILSLQHYKTLTENFKKFGLNIALYTRSQKKLNGQESSQKAIIDAVAGGEIDLVVGTHSLIQKKVSFAKLGLVIIDEQHRFGVDQRKMLKLKSKTGITPHLLSMTATPIPRTLALTFYGDLDISLITELPKNRKPIITRIVPPDKRNDAYEFIANETKKGRQIFVICPLINESDKLGVKSVTEEYKKLSQHVFPQMPIGMLHGKLKKNEKEKVMDDFAGNKTSLLVSTSVVEVGIDVPNATIMMIEGAERFGLAQLHQFRGRVGRSHHQSFCLVFTDSDRPKTKERLEALTTAKNGFELAELDLKFRGAGELYGIRQSGFPDFKIAKLTDVEIIKTAREIAQQIFSIDPELKDFPLLLQKIKQLDKSIHLE